MSLALRWLKLAAVLILWALSFVLNEIALRDLGPAAVAASRWLITSLLILTLLMRQRQLTRLWAALRADWRRFLLLALFGVTLLYGLQTTGQTQTTAINAGLLSNTVPVFTALLATIFLRERLRAVGWMGILAALMGAWTVSAAGQRLALRSDALLGDLLVLLSALCGAIYFVVGKDLLSSYPPLIVTAAAAALGAATLLPAAWIENDWGSASLATAGAVLALGVGPGLLANLWWWQTAEWLDASRAAVYVYLIPLVTMAFAAFFLGETVGLAQLAGAALVLLGVWLAERGLQG